MNASKTAICLVGNAGDHITGMFSILTRFSNNAVVFGHVISSTETADKIRNLYLACNLSCSTSRVSSTKKYRIGDVLKNGDLSSSSYALPHIDDTYCLMMAMMHKKAYEINNNMRFDRVICGRVDTDNSDLLEPMIASINSISPGQLLCRTSRNPLDNWLWSIDTRVIAGSSRDMDTLSRFHHAYEEKFWQMVGAGEHDPGYRSAKLGALLWKWSTMRNLSPHGL